MANFLLDTEAVPMLKRSGIPVREPLLRVHKGLLLRQTDRVSRGGKRENRRVREMEGRAKPHQKGGIKIHNV